MELITIPAHHTSNSYTTVTDADTYISQMRKIEGNTSWGSLYPKHKNYALFVAARALNSFKYRGKPVTKNQKLAFPRYTDAQLSIDRTACNKYDLYSDRIYDVASGRTYSPGTVWNCTADYEQLDNFYDATYTQIVEDGEITISGNRLISAGATALFEDAFDDKDLVLNQVIRVEGLTSGSYDYLTVIDMDEDGEWIEVKETLSDETDLVLTIWSSDIFGYPKTVEYAQIELALQVVNTKIFQQDITENVEPQIQSFSLSGAMSVRYSTELMRRGKFEDSGPMDIVYHLLDDWMAGIKGGVV